MSARKGFIDVLVHLDASTPLEVTIACAIKAGRKFQSFGAWTLTNAVVAFTAVLGTLIV